MKILTLKKGAKKGFKFLAGINRAVIPSQVNTLAKSVERKGCLRPVVVAKLKFIDGGKDYFIIDAQHLYTCLLRLSMDIPYIEIAILDKKDLVETIALLNASSRSWTMDDYITSWSFISSDYQKLKDFVNIYDFDRNFTAGVLSDGYGTAGGGKAAVIKRGDFKVSKVEDATFIFNCLTDILKITPRMPKNKTRYLCAEFTSFLRGKIGKYNHPVFLSKVKKETKAIVLATQETGALSKLFEKL